MSWRKYIPVMAILIPLGISIDTGAQLQPLSLENCKKMALEQNKKIRSAQYELDAAGAAHEAARRNDLPGVDASVTGAHLGKPLDKLLPSFIGDAGITIQQPIYAGGKIRLGKQATAKVVEIYRQQKALTEAEVLLNVETAYWRIVQVNDKIMLANKYKAMLEALHTDLQNAFDAGLIYKNDLLRVEVSLNEAALNITKANDGLVLAKMQLAQIMGWPDTLFVITDSVSAPPDASSVQSPGPNAWNARPEIVLLQHSIEAEQVQEKLIRADLKPTAGAALSGFGVAGKQINLTNGKDQLISYYGLLNINVPLFEWGRNAQKVKEQNLRIKARQAQLEDTRELIGLEVQNAWIQVKQSLQKIQLSNLSLQQAEENLRLTNDRFRAGTIVGKDVQEAQVIWQQAYSAVIDARVEYRISEAAYQKATGTIR